MKRIRPEYIRLRPAFMPPPFPRRHLVREGLLVLCAALASGLLIIGLAFVIFIFLTTTK